MHKSKFFVERDAGRVGDINSQEREANAFASMFFVYVD